MKTISATEARIRFGELMRQVVDRHEPITVERNGKPSIVLLSVSEYERLQNKKQQEWESLLSQAHNLIRRERSESPLPPVEDIIREMREERDEKFLDLC